MEAATGKQIDDMFDLLNAMKDLQGPAIDAIVQREKEEDRKNSDTKSPMWSPKSVASTVASSKYGNKYVTPMSKGIAGSCVFPSASQMVSI